MGVEHRGAFLQKDLMVTVSLFVFLDAVRIASRYWIRIVFIFASVTEVIVLREKIP